MLIIRIWNYFRGYVIIRIEGLTLEKFINLSIARGIYLWDIVRYDYTTLEAKIGINGFKELKEVVRRVGCRVSIIQKRGYPFLMHKLKYRKMLAFGFFLSLGIVIFLTSFIWSVEIEGNKTLKEEYIIKNLEKIGVEPGTFKYKLDTSDLNRNLLTRIDKLSFVHTEIKGTKLIIEVKERENKPKRIDEDAPCNIVAKKKAVVEKVIAKSGKSIVKKGDIVKEGQILIYGIIDDERMSNPLLVHSEGSVVGTTWYTKKFEEPIVKEIKEETGRVYSTKEIKIGSKVIQSRDGDIPFDNYIEEIKRKKIIDNKFLDVSIELVTHNYKEVSIEKAKQNVDSLKKMVIVKGVQEIMDSLPKGGTVVSKDVKFSIEEGILITIINIEVKEEIGIKKRIQINRED